MQSDRQKELDKYIELLDLGMIRKLSTEIMKDSTPSNYVIPSKWNNGRM